MDKKNRDIQATFQEEKEKWQVQIKDYKEKL